MDEQLNLPGVYEGSRAYPATSAYGGITRAQAAVLRRARPPRVPRTQAREPYYSHGRGAISAVECRSLLRLASQVRARNQADC